MSAAPAAAARLGRYAARALLPSLLLALLAVLIRAVLAVPLRSHDLAARVAGRVSDSGVANPVTAVLLNFRGYDTLLEVCVLLLTAVAILALRALPAAPRPPPPGEVLTAFVRLLAPLLIMAAGYLLWAGAAAPGGSFQAGAVLGGLGVIWMLAGLRVPGPPPWFGRALLAGGAAVFLIVAAAMPALGGAFLEYPRGLASSLILVIEAALVVSIALTATVLFSGGLMDR